MNLALELFLTSLTTIIIIVSTFYILHKLITKVEKSNER